MEKTSHSSGFESHPGKSLEDHLTGVAALAEYFAKNISCQDFSGLKDFCRILALSHDLGKASGYFQDYLHADAARQKKLKTELSSHSLFSAVCAYYLVKEFFSGNDAEYYPFFAYLAVKHHHGNLKDIKADAIFDSEEKSLIEKQLSSVSEENFNTLGRHLFEAGLSIKINKEIISGWLGNFGAELRRHKRSLGKDRGDLSKYLFLNLAYSILIDADKSDVVIGDIKQFRRSEQEIGESLVDNFKAQQQFIGSPLNTLRESAYQEALNKNIDISQKLYSLNLPTGLGKTLTS
ncbi:CRISPR-associated endonuclease Cas3'', partial [Caldithrix abyssi]